MAGSAKGGGLMSYCRWSTDDYMCDLYVYDSVSGGIAIHIATNRLTYKEPLPDSVSYLDIGAFMARNEKVGKMVDEADRVKIDLPYAGESWDGLSNDEAIEFLIELRQLGYRFPEHVIGMIQEEDD